MLSGKGVSELYADIEFYRLISVVGARRSGKDLLCSELARHFLDKKRVTYKFYSNQLHVWNDDLWITDRDLYLSRYSDRAKYPYPERVPVVDKYPDVRWRVFDLTEGGRYLRQYAYFEDLFEFAGKFHDIFFFPSVRESHEDLMTMTIYPIRTLRSLYGDNLPTIGNRVYSLAGLWGWAIEDGFNPKRNNKFWFIPDKWTVGIYDTEDTSEKPDGIIQAVKKEIEFDNIARGRDGVQALDARFAGTDADARRTAQRRIEQFTLTLLQQGRGKTIA